MELHEIRYFLAVCQTLNFTRAAELCTVTQPALTRAIQKIEGEVGGLLFARERGNTHLTELGRLKQPHLEEVQARTRAAKDQAAKVAVATFTWFVPAVKVPLSRPRMTDDSTLPWASPVLVSKRKSTPVVPTNVLNSTRVFVALFR